MPCQRWYLCVSLLIRMKCWIMGVGDFGAVTYLPHTSPRPPSLPPHSDHDTNKDLWYGQKSIAFGTVSIAIQERKKKNHLSRKDISRHKRIYAVLQYFWVAYTGWPRKNATTLIVNFKNIVDETELFFILFGRTLIFHQNDTMIINFG